MRNDKRTRQKVSVSSLMSRDALKRNCFLYQETPTQCHRPLAGPLLKSLELADHNCSLPSPLDRASLDTAVEGEKWAEACFWLKDKNFPPGKWAKNWAIGNILSPGQYLIKHSWQRAQRIEESTRQTFNQQDCSLPLHPTPPLLCPPWGPLSV